MELQLFEPFDKSKHDREPFCCGIASLDSYLKERASQDVRRDVARVFVKTNDDGVIVAYYSLSAYTISISELPDNLVKKLPRYPLIPAILLGRLAVDTRLQGQGYGYVTLTDALLRASLISKQLGSAAVVAEAVNERASSFYRKYGFIPFKTDSLKLFLAMTRVKSTLAAES